MRGLANEDAQKNVPLGKTDYQAGDFSGDTKTTLDLEDDAAFCNWGGAWRMPTKGEFDTFFSGASYSGGDLSYKGVTFPAAGFGHYTELYESPCIYWSSSLYTDSSSDAYGLIFNYGYVDTDYCSRCSGYSVRPLSE